jgi:hypothetical protein
MTAIIICEEKHDTAYWDASTPEQFAESALAILTWRWNDGYWYHDPDSDGLGSSEWAEKEREQRRKALAMTVEEISALPESAQKAINGLRARAKRESAEDRRHREWYTRAKRVVAEQDTSTVTVGRGRFAREVPEAWVLLEERSDHEYEHVELMNDLWTRERFLERNARIEARRAEASNA